MSTDVKIGGRDPRLTKRPRVNFRATGLGKAVKTDVQPAASKKEEKIDHTPTISKSTDQADAKPLLAETPPLNHRDSKQSKTLSRKERQIKKNLLRQRKILRRLEEKEREPLEKGGWSDTRTTMLGKNEKIGGMALPLESVSHN